jgi:hypothetical protein
MIEGREDGQNGDMCISLIEPPILPNPPSPPQINNNQKKWYMIEGREDGQNGDMCISLIEPPILPNPPP